MLWFHLMFIGGCSTSIDLIWKVITLQTLWFISFGVFTPVPHGCQDWSILMPFWLKIDQSISFISAPTTPTLVFFRGGGIPTFCQRECTSSDHTSGFSGVMVEISLLWSQAVSPDACGERVIISRSRWFCSWGNVWSSWCIADLFSIGDFVFVWPICQIFRSFISSWCIARWIFILWFDIILADQPVVRFCTPNLPTSLGVKNRGPLHWGVSMWSHAFCKNLIDIYIYIYIYIHCIYCIYCI